MEHKKAQKLIKTISDNIKENGITPETLIENLKALRVYAVEEKRPVIAKSLRLICEHVNKYGSFVIPIPNDEPIEGQENENELITGDDSLLYFISLIKNSDNSLNLQEIREYNRLMSL